MRPLHARIQLYCRGICINSSSLYPFDVQNSEKDGIHP